MHWIYLIHKFHNLSWITEINELFHNILIYWDVPVFVTFVYVENVKVYSLKNSGTNIIKKFNIHILWWFCIVKGKKTFTKNLYIWRFSQDSFNVTFIYLVFVNINILETSCWLHNVAELKLFSLCLSLELNLCSCDIFILWVTSSLILSILYR